MWHLDIPKCQERDHGKIEVIARWEPLLKGYTRTEILFYRVSIIKLPLQVAVL
jgi:hypothetical protein